MGISSSRGANLPAAARSGDVETVTQTLQWKPDADFFTLLLDRATASLLAADNGHRDVLLQIWEAAVQAKGKCHAIQFAIHCPSRKGNTALMEACKHGHLRCISFLLAHGVDPLPINGAPDGGTALHVAVSHIQNECVARLLHSIVAGVQGRPTGLQDLHVHINTGFTRYVDQCNSWGLAPLHLAALRGCQATVSSLIRGGAALDTPMRGVDVHGSADSRSWLCDGSTALHVACARGFFGIVMILLDAAAAPGVPDIRQIRNSRGIQPGTLLRTEDHHQMAQVLHEAGSDVRRAGLRRAARALGPDLGQQRLLLVQRAKLLQSLRTADLKQKGFEPSPINAMEPGAQRGNLNVLELLSSLDAIRQVAARQPGEDAPAQEVLAGRDHTLVAMFWQAASEAVEQVTAAGCSEVQPAGVTPMEAAAGVVDSVRELGAGSIQRGGGHPGSWAREPQEALLPADESLWPDVCPASRLGRHPQQLRRQGRALMQRPSNAGDVERFLHRIYGGSGRHTPRGDMEIGEPHVPSTSEEGHPSAAGTVAADIAAVRDSPSSSQLVTSGALAAGGAGCGAPATWVPPGAAPCQAAVPLGAQRARRVPEHPIEAYRSMSAVPARDARYEVTAAEAQLAEGADAAGSEASTGGRRGLEQDIGEDETCFICFDRNMEVRMVGEQSSCGHARPALQVCTCCAYRMCAQGMAPPTCPFCRTRITAFAAAMRST